MTDTAEHPTATFQVPAPRTPTAQPTVLAEPLSAPHDPGQLTVGALLEQAKGVLAFRYALDCESALRVLELWAAERGDEVVTIADALVRDICQGAGTGGDPELVRWLEDKLRKECPALPPQPTTRATPVVVLVDCSYTSLDRVVAAARNAARLGVPLELRVEEPGERAAGVTRAHLIQRVDLAVEVARAVEPGLLIRLPACHLLGP